MYKRQCKDKGLWGIGVDADQREFFIDTKPEIADVILTSMTKRNDITMAKAIKDTVEGTAEYGKLYKWGLKEGITVLAENDYYKAQVPQETQDYIGGLSAKIASGEIEVKMVYGMDQDEYVTFRDSCLLYTSSPPGADRPLCPRRPGAADGGDGLSLIHISYVSLLLVSKGHVQVSCVTSVYRKKLVLSIEKSNFLYFFLDRGWAAC